MQRVLFICTHNSARSQMAEGLVNHDLAGKVQAFSAGTFGQKLLKQNEQPPLEGYRTRLKGIPRVETRPPARSSFPF